jgi:hypothetical protein
MADRNAPNDASRKSKADGDRCDADGERGELPGAASGRQVLWDEEVLNRHAVDTTPRRYEQPLAEDNR